MKRDVDRASYLAVVVLLMLVLPLASLLLKTREPGRPAERENDDADHEPEHGDDEDGEPVISAARKSWRTLRPPS